MNGDAVGLAAAYSQTGAAWQAGPGLVYDGMSQALVDASPVALAGRLVLDVGAGTGAASRAIERAGGHPIAADVARGMLRSIVPGRWPGVAADARALPIAGHSVGAVVAAFSYNHVPDPAHALAEARRVVAPGGAVLASAYASDDDHPVKAAVDAAASEAGWVPAPWVAEMRAEAAPLLSTTERADAVAVAAGLTSRCVAHVDVPFPDLTAADLVAWRMGMAQVRPYLASLAPEARDAIAARALELLGEAPPLVRRMIVITAVT